MRARFPIVGIVLLLGWLAGLGRASEAGMAVEVMRDCPFRDPLLPLGGELPTDGETQSLAHLLHGLRIWSVPEQLRGVEEYVASHTESPWTPSLRSHLARYYREHGCFTAALAQWAAAWEEIAQEESPNAKALADRILAHWAELLRALGNAEALGDLLQAAGESPLDAAHLQVMLDGGREAWGQMVSQPEASFRCGVAALGAVAERLRPGRGLALGLTSRRATPRGLNLDLLARWANELGLGLVPVRRDPSAPLAVPSVVHLRLGHFAGAIARQGARVLVVDPAFAGPKWLREADLRAEASGYCLVLEEDAASGSTPLDVQTAAKVWGRGYPNTIPDQADLHPLITTPLGIAGWRISEPFINLWVDLPVVAYPASAGQHAVHLAYRQRNSRSTSGCYHFGPAWESSLLSYVEFESVYDLEFHRWENTTGPLYLPLGGNRLFTDDGVTTEYLTQAALTKEDGGGSTSNAVYTLTFKNGAYYTYNYRQDFAFGERRAYVSSYRDPQGRTLATWSYTATNSTARLAYLRDQDGRDVTFTYDAVNVGRVTAVVDPYGRTNTFHYSAAGTLTNFLNPENFGTGFRYDAQGVITNLLSPLGVTTFRYGANTNTGNVVNRWMEVTEPGGAGSLFLYRDRSTKLNDLPGAPDFLPFSYSAGVVPVTGSPTNVTARFDNTWMDARNSFSWGPSAFLWLQTNSNYGASGNPADLTLADYKMATLSHWLRETNSLLSATVSLQRGPSPDGQADGQMIWFDHWDKPMLVGTNYQGQTITNWYLAGSSPRPRYAALVLPNGASRYTLTEYNSAGNPTRVISTYDAGGGVGTRTNRFVYSPDGRDLRWAYDAADMMAVSNTWNSRHQLLTTANALGETTTFTYQSAAPYKLTSVRTPAGLLTTNYYYASGMVGFLEKTVVPALQVTNSFTYSNALVRTATDPRGLTTTNTYDRLQRLVSINGPNGTATLSYSNLFLVATADVLGATNRFSYDPHGRKLWDADPLNRTNRYAYSASGALVAITNALGLRVGFAYDNLGRLVGTVRPDNSTITHRYNALGQLVSVTDPAGRSLTNYYNHRGLLYAASNAAGQLQLTRFDQLDRATNTVAVNGVAVSSTYDSLGRLRTRAYPDGGLEAYGYSPNQSGPTAYTNQLSEVTRFGYDLAGRQVARTNANLAVTRWSYGGSGELLSLTDGKNQVTAWGYDLYARVRSKTNAAGAEVLRYAYDAVGRLTNRWTKAKGATTYRYDLVGNLTNVDYPVSPDVTLSYDALKRVTNRTDAAGVTRSTFDLLGRLQAEDGPWAEDTVSYTYLVNDLLEGLTLAHPNASPWLQSYTHDAVNRLTNLVSPAGAFGYQYHSGLGGVLAAGGPVLRRGLPNGAAVTNEFDSVGRLLGSWLRHPQGGVIERHSYTNNLAGQLIGQIRWDGSVVTYQYDRIGQLIKAAGWEAGGAARAHEQFGYGYDAAGNLVSRTNQTLVQSFAQANLLNRLSTVSRSGTLTVAGMAQGVPTTVSVKDNANPAQAAIRYADQTFARTNVTLLDGANTFTAVATDGSGRGATNTVTVNLPASVSFTYDDNGNLTADGLLTYGYDDENQLITITAAGAWRSEFTYDSLGRRRLRREYTWSSGAWVLAGETRYVYDGQLVLQERDGNNLPRGTYTRGLDLSGALEGAGGIGGLLARTDNPQLGAGNAAAHAYYHADGSGHVTILLDSQGTVVARYLYDPSGSPLGAAGPLAETNLCRASSKEVHERSGLVYFGRRYYAPTLQRWLNEDPLGEAGGVHLYAYVRNEPVRGVDPYGLQERKHWRSLKDYPSLSDFVVDLTPLFKDMLGNPSGQVVVSTGYWSGSFHSTSNEQGQEVTHFPKYVGIGYYIPAGDLPLFFHTIRSEGLNAMYQDEPTRALLLGMRRTMQPNGPGTYSLADFTRLVADVSINLAALPLMIPEQATALALRSLLGLGRRAATEVLPGAAKSGTGSLVPMSENLFANGTSRTVAGYHVYGNAGLVGETYNVNILGLYAQEGSQGLRALSSAFKAEAQAAGATRISISGNTIINEGISGLSPAAAQRFGFQLQKVNNQTIILTAPIAP